ncbi:L-seryl-tRNA(Sec) selenium transferase [Geodia barretti]|uniref:L-seryl-tRNA(Sec) selenium transferase n=3 Tax=Geodia barretti TaxID=519541 RepID=A0AA35SZ94_GEOBA|nr:L-seryl-tRNA(Sec) selenium transferase [Geodia barretti]
MTIGSELRNLPSVERVLNTDTLAAAVDAHGREMVVDLAREVLDGVRKRVLAGSPAPAGHQIAEAVLDLMTDLAEPSPRPVINATGVVIHTNLGRAPLSDAALAAADAVGRGYSDLEIDLGTGRRGSRQAHLQSLLRRITGAEAALAVNNNASALLLGLSALAAGREVIVSRGEAVEIGGGFRIPDVLRQSGCTLVDVGTTNRTYVRDYADAMTEQTGAFLKAHASNFKVEGFTAFVGERELVALGESSGVPVLHDVGSGALLPTDRYGLAHEPTPQESIAAGVGLVFFSGDKLLGGPQAGIVVGKRDLVTRLERHPLARAVRIDKMSLASLTATLAHYAMGEAENKVPVWRMISTSAEDVRARADNWRAALATHQVQTGVEPARSAIGGGSLPGETLPSWTLSVDPSPDRSPEAVLSALRDHSTPVIARIADDTVRLDPRTVLPEQDDDVIRAIATVMAR